MSFPSSSFRSKRKVNIMDSLGLLTDLFPNTILLICKLVNTNNHLSLFRRYLCIKKTSECGLFAIMFAMETCLNENVELVSFKQVAMHEHLHRG